MRDDYAVTRNSPITAVFDPNLGGAGAPNRARADEHTDKTTTACPSAAKRSAAGPTTGHTETFATAQHSEPAADDSEPRSDVGEPAEAFSAEEEEVSQTAAQAAPAAAAAAVAVTTVKTTPAADAAEATDSTEAAKVVFTAAAE